MRGLSVYDLDSVLSLRLHNYRTRNRHVRQKICRYYPHEANILPLGGLWMCEIYNWRWNSSIPNNIWEGQMTNVAHRRFLPRHLRQEADRQWGWSLNTNVVGIRFHRLCYLMTGHQNYYCDCHFADNQLFVIGGVISVRSADWKVPTEESSNAIVLEISKDIYIMW